MLDYRSFYSGGKVNTNSYYIFGKTGTNSLPPFHSAFYKTRCRLVPYALSHRTELQKIGNNNTFSVGPHSFIFLPTYMILRRSSADRGVIRAMYAVVVAWKYVRIRRARKLQAHRCTVDRRLTAPLWPRYNKCLSPKLLKH